MTGMTYRCNKCGRRLLSASASGYGPVCALFVFGAKPKREKREPVKRDELTGDLFAGVMA